MRSKESPSLPLSKSPTSRSGSDVPRQAEKAKSPDMTHRDADGNESWDVVVIGAGAAGLLAGTRAAECGARTLLLEKMPRPGTKILMSGGTRCNITHDTDRQGIIEAFGVKGQGRFLHSALSALGPRELVALIEAEGTPTMVEPGRGKIFPASNRATDVLAALLRRLERSGCCLALSEPVTELRRDGAGYGLRTPRRSVRCAKLIVTTGGKSYPGSGSTGDGYKWLAELGHTIVTPRPALTPITTDADWVRELRGNSLQDAIARIVPGERAAAGAGASPRRAKPLAERREAVLFTHFGLSGPAILDVSRAVSLHADPRSLDLELDMLPDVRPEQLDEQIRRECSADGRKQLTSLIVRQLPRRMIELLAVQLGLPESQRAAELSRADRARWVATIKGARIPVSGVRGFQVAEVTSGGVSLREVDSRTMQSKLAPNLYLAGEVLDLDGPIGGYNFQAAFSTAWLAGETKE